MTMLSELRLEWVGTLTQGANIADITHTWSFVTTHLTSRIRPLLVKKGTPLFLSLAVNKEITALEIAQAVQTCIQFRLSNSTYFRQSEFCRTLEFFL